jgi:hypothetical protein
MGIYKNASRKKLNKEKTSLFSSKNTKAPIKQHFTASSKLRATRAFEKYLGLPVMVGKSRMHAFKSIKDRIWSRMSNWKMITRRQGNFIEISCSRHPDLYNEYFHAA